ncbi:hypothetical protein H257_05460 [Aphanomyces astaci]|uniref:Uncharacterized protein n=1 Tax=Aphanomyces astaci TaxID=112090 RepID=W4GQD3_APHAT|nr:hypothetical protein H257_05460 [Aphanomyces astaci]ETV81922.1 hypothetical protein H257_05460 [Aphanomyces astaci]|eukprot:XP_009828659.1 hypothetical protein H257_05460 [Aphanomyces astaci]
MYATGSLGIPSLASASWWSGTKGVTGAGAAVVVVAAVVGAAVVVGAVAVVVGAAVVVVGAAETSPQHTLTSSPTVSRLEHRLFCVLKIVGNASFLHAPEYPSHALFKIAHDESPTTTLYLTHLAKSIDSSVVEGVVVVGAAVVGVVVVVVVVVGA